MSDLLYSKVNGSGQNVVLLHGWGMHGGLWGTFNDYLSANTQTHSIDLPGFGFSSKMENDFSLHSITEVVESYIKKLTHPVSVIGWSLGGLIILNILKRKNIKLDKVVFIASTPCFTKKPDWEDAMEASVFSEFSKDLHTDYKKTLKRFMLLQTRNSELSKPELSLIIKNLSSRGEPNIKALKMGLTILSETDLRGTEQYDTPAMLILGENDTLVPINVKNEFIKIFSNLKPVLLKKTGHAPFISSPEYCTDIIKKFIHE